MTAPDIATVPQFSGEEKMDKRTELDVEDSYYLLHALESEAFSCVVTAMRAQGMLTEYKQILLEHLKAALFVSDSTYKAEMRRAANDEVLCKIAETLNPSYDSFVQWGLAANDIIPPAFNQIPLYADQDIEGLDVAGQLLRLANSHNSAVDNYNDALHELITLPKAPFVPEKLRVILRETESDPNERADLCCESGGESLGSRNKKVVGVNDKRNKKVRNNQKNIKQVEEKADLPTSSNTEFSSDSILHIPNNVPISKQKIAFENKDDQRLSSSQEFHDIKQLEESLSGNVEFRSQNLNTSNVSMSSFEAYDGAQVVSGEKAQQKLDMKKIVSLSAADEKSCPKIQEEGKWRRKKSKQKENTKDTCARVRPFLFENGSPGQVKPPRGNPDRRAFKRTSPTFSCSSSANGMACAAGLSPQSFPTSISSRPPAHTPLSPNISRFPTSQGPNSGYHSLGVVIKRMRTASSSEPTNSHSGYYGRDGSGPLKAQLSERAYPRVLVSPSQSAAAWSNPARPYYGNPSAAAMGVTVRSSPVSSSSSNSGICSSNAGTSVEKVLQSPQSVANINDTQQHGNRHYSSSPVFLTVGHQQNKVTPRRSSYSSKTNSSSVHVSPVPNTSMQSGSSFKNPSSPGSRQTLHVERNTSGVGTELNTKDDASNSINSDDCANTQEMRLECDEVMAPEHRSAISPRISEVMSPVPVQIKHVLHTSEAAPRVSQQLSVLLSYEDTGTGGVHLNRVVEPQFINGLLHQDEQEIVGMITSEQCIR